ncbi:PLP-dependent aminotransferase family protein [Williamsia sp. 1135]|uniref:MocR-like pyridoxine biosynthesis transcription factor PdxR n=1 Tax=Williamsia sp. 1135 TaxID=1889262 RepID=UPI000A109B83|nr:PLP-dependent aminotransferase family protein [Williamsia sp. 1135]ORM37662.1 GntR family transcriptional regulator [Williamsia sp. 1135]
MSDSWSNSGDGTPPSIGGVDLHLDLHTGRVREALVDALRDAVRSSRLAPGTSLPPTRSLAADLGMARNTVVQAYSELVAEGWLISRQGAGTVVAQRTPDSPRPVPAGARTSAPHRHLHDLRPGRPDVSAFPRTEWIRAVRRAVSSAPDSAFGYGDCLGRPELRAAVSNYLARTRGVDVTPERVIVCSGASHGFALLAQALREQGVSELAVESYGLGIHRKVFLDNGVRTRPIGVDDLGARIADLDALGSRAVLLTPSHQFPTGVALDPERRNAFVDWARRTGGIVIEDDYDGEFRYDRRPIGALQGLDPDHVVYVGTTSKSLAPGLRLGWMVLPERLVPAVADFKGAHEVVGVVDQLAMADLIETGAYDRHVRAMRLRYRRRRDQLVAAVADAAPDSRITGMNAGLHVLLELASGNESAVVEGSAWQDLAVYGLAQFRHPDITEQRDALVIGYGTPSASGWPGALEALCRVLP